jgi:beta-lactamase regulating signal transducer with metallopeptidase domain
MFAASTMYVTCLLVAAGLAARLLRGSTAAVRHVVWSAGAGGAAVAVVTFVLAGRLLRPYRPLLRLEFDFRVPWPASVTVAIVSVWLLGVLVLLLRLAGAALILRLRVRRARPVTSPEWRELLETAAASAGVRRRVALRAGGVAVPFTCGVLRPVIVLPVEALSWPASRRRFVLLHELAHVARFDALTGAVECLAGAIFWFHPFVWAAIRNGRAEREKACDDLVVERTGDAPGYAAALLALACGAGALPAGAHGLAATELERRIVSILDTGRPREAARPLHVVVAGCAVAALIVGALLIGAGPAAVVDICAAGAEPSLTRIRPRPRLIRLREFARCTEAAVIETAAPDGRPRTTVVLQTVDTARTQRMTFSEGTRAFRVDGAAVAAGRGAAWVEEVLRRYDTMYTGAPIRRAIAVAEGAGTS